MTTRVQRLLLKPAMCGPSALFLGQVGDWTWDAVSEACQTNVFSAHDERGTPAYLAFYYYRVRASAAFHVGALTFGDWIEVRSNVFGFGSESVLTLHEIRPSSGGPLDSAPLDCVEFYERPRRGRIYIENFNRWITRSVAKSNDGLMVASPPEFRFEHLPALPQQYSPRPIFSYARENRTFLSGAAAEAKHRIQFEYAIDASRDVNAVGLVYFASYFAIVDGAILRLWRALGRDEASFVERVVSDRQICYLGNAPVDAVLEVDAVLRLPANDAGSEIFDVTLRVRGGARLIAVSTQRISRKEIPT